MEEQAIPDVTVGVLLPFDYNLYHVAIILEVFTRANLWCEEQGIFVRFDVKIFQTQGQINAYSDTFFNYPVVNTLSELQPSFVIIPPVNTVDITDNINRNKVFRDWIALQYQQNAQILSVGNGIVLTAFAGLLDHRTVKLNSVKKDFFEQFPLVKRSSGATLQYLDRIILSSGQQHTFFILFELIGTYCGTDIVQRLSKYYQVDLNLVFDKHFSDFDFIYDTHDTQIDEVLQKIHTNYDKIKSLEDVLNDFEGSKRSFNRKFIEQVHLTPTEYLQNVRVAYAKRLLEKTSKSVDAISHLVGYEDSKSFRIIFSRITGLNPLEYRKRLQVNNLYRTEIDSRNK